MENLFNGIPNRAAEEVFNTLLQNKKIKIERIVSFGQATPEGEWLIQDIPEWVVLLKGTAGLKFKGQENILNLTPGDYLHIPAKTSHRVEWTDKTQATIWLAVHYQ
jgi:cupin 2 domain-containing protein